jgi:hypothetical protein
MDINELIQGANAQDFTKEDSGKTFERELPEAGVGVCRFREYIELGTHPTASKKYPNKKPAKKARFVFELTTPKHIREVEKEDGTKIKIPHILTVECAISASGRSNFIKLFKCLNWQEKYTHPAQALGDPFLVTIHHAWKDGDDPNKDKPSYANMMKDGAYTIQPARKVDPIANTVDEIPVPELLGDMRVFLWDNPTKETWDSLFIDGTYEKDGEEVSKNWVQEKILGSLEYEGSPLEAMLVGFTPPSTEPITEPAPGTVQDPLSELGL